MKFLKMMPPYAHGDLFVVIGSYHFLSFSSFKFVFVFCVCFFCISFLFVFNVSLFHVLLLNQRCMFEYGYKMPAVCYTDCPLILMYALRFGHFSSLVESI